MESSRPLLVWDGTPGILCDWHLIGPFDSGLQFNPNPNLFDLKVSKRWAEDHLAPWGGCAQVFDASTSVEFEKQDSPEWTGDLAPLSLNPALSLNQLKADYPSWESKLQDKNSDQWKSLYYALAVVVSPRPMACELLFSGWDGCRLWVNGALSFEEHRFHHAIIDHEAIPVQLRQGRNSFLFQLDRDGVVARLRTSASDAVKELESVALRDAPEPRKISTFAQLRRQAAALKVAMPFTGEGKEDLMSWQTQAREFYTHCLGPTTYTSNSSKKDSDSTSNEGLGRGQSVELEEEVACEGYTRRRYLIACEGDTLLPCYVLIPDEPSRNGRTVLHPHGHAMRFGMVAGVTRPKGPRLWVGDYTGNYGEQLAQRGFVTAVMCERAFEERRDHFGGGDPCTLAGLQAQAMGYTLPRLHLADIHRMYDLVCSLPEVDSNRVGSSGLSGGATLSYLLGALDERIKAFAVFCGLCRYEDYAMGAGCGMQIVPGLYPTLDVGELLGLIAPRALLLGQGRLDATFNVLRLHSIAEDARRAYRAAGAEERLEVHTYEKAHQFDVDLAEAFFLKSL